MIVNRTQLADILGVSPTTVLKRVEQGMPVQQRGDRTTEWVFDTVAVIKWLQDVASGSADTEKSENEKVRTRAETRQTVAAAALKELELGQRQKVLVHVDDLVMLMDEQFAVLKSRFNALPARLAQRVAIETDPAECRKMLREEVNQAYAAIASAEVLSDRLKAGE